jgi:hypothetical protein
MWCFVEKIRSTRLVGSALAGLFSPFVERG